MSPNLHSNRFRDQTYAFSRCVCKFRNVLECFLYSYGCDQVILTVNGNNLLAAKQQAIPTNLYRIECYQFIPHYWTLSKA